MNKHLILIIMLAQAQITFGCHAGAGTGPSEKVRMHDVVLVLDEHTTKVFMGKRDDGCEYHFLEYNYPERTICGGSFFPLPRGGYESFSIADMDQGIYNNLYMHLENRVGPRLLRKANKSDRK